MDVRKEVIVVGGGIAGLTAALTLSSKGKDVLLIEKNDYCGGLMNTFERDGFRFEGGARALVNAGLVKPLAEEFKIDIEFLPNPVSIIVEDKVLKVDGVDSIDEYAKILKELYPESMGDVDRIIFAIKGVIEDMKVLYGVDNPLFEKGKKNILNLLYVVPWFFKFLRTIYRIGKLQEPIESYMDKLTSNRSLRDIIIQHFFKGTPTFFALSYFALYNDYIYPKGGVGNFTRKIAEKIKELGGEILLNTEIVSVDVSENKLIDSNGKEYNYEKLIWTADLKQFYLNLKNIPEKFKGKFNTEKEKILNAKGAESVFTLFLELDIPAEFFGEIVTGHMFYTPKKEGLGELHRLELKRLIQNWKNIKKEDVYSWLEKFVKYNTFEISIPALREKQAAPDGKTGMIVSLLFDYKLTDLIYKDGWYDEFKEKFSEFVIDAISEGVFDGLKLKDKIIAKFSATPITIHKIVKSSDGAIVGWSFEEGIPVNASMMNMKAAVRTSIPNVFKAGQWTFSPAGGPTSIMTGRMAANECE